MRRLMQIVPSVGIMAGIGLCLFWGMQSGKTPEEILYATSQPYLCGRTECSVCDTYYQWIEENPDREPGDMIHAAEQGIPIRQPD